MHSTRSRRVLEAGFAVCTLFLAVESAMLLLLLGHRIDWPGSLPVAKAAVTALCALAELVWPWPVAVVALAMLAALRLAFRSRPGASEVAQ